MATKKMLTEDSAAAQAQDSGSVLGGALSATYAGLPAPVKNALTGWYHADGYGAVGDTTTDNSAVINSLITAVIAAGGGKIYFPFVPGSTGIYRFDQIVVEGIGNVNLTIEAADGVILRAAPLLTTDAIIIRSSGTYDAAGSNFIRRVTLKNLNIQGQTDWASGTKIDRRGVVVTQAQDVVFDKVKITQFKKGALILDEAWDNYFADVELKWSGYGLDNSNYAHALQLISTTGGNSNNNRFSSLHMEFCNLEILFDNNARQNFFVNFKLENGGGTEQNTSTIAPIWDKAGIENTFTSGMLVQGHSTDVPRIRTTVNADAYLTTYNVRQSLKFVSCLFFATSAHKARWFSGQNTTFENVTAQRSNGGGSIAAFELIGNCTFSKGGISLADLGVNVFRVYGSNNLIDAPHLAAGTGGTAGGALFFLGAGATKNMVRDWTVSGSIASASALDASYNTAGTTGSNVFVNERDNTSSTTGGGTKNVFHRTLLKLTDSSPATYSLLANGYTGQTLTILATTANVTLQHGNVINGIALKSGADKTMTVNETVTVRNLEGVWREI